MATSRYRGSTYALIGLALLSAAIGYGLLWLSVLIHTLASEPLATGTLRNPVRASFAVPALSGKVGDTQEISLTFDSQGAPIQEVHIEVLTPAFMSNVTVRSTDPSCNASLTTRLVGNKLTSSCVVQQKNQLVSPFILGYTLSQPGAGRLSLTSTSSARVSNLTMPVLPVELVVTSK